MQSKVSRILGNQFFVDQDYFYPGASYIYFANQKQLKLILTARTKNNFSFLLSLDVDLASMIGTASKPIISLGAKDSFDENGISYPCIFEFNNQKYLFYTGWSLRTNNPFKNTLGYSRFGDEINKIGPLSIIKDKGFITEIGSMDIFKFQNSNYMFFTKFDEWDGHNPRYSIRVAKSEGISTWILDRSFNLNKINELSSMVSRPSIVRYQSQYLIFFCYREKNLDYKIGLAQSSNFFSWKLISKDVFKNLDLESWCKEGQAYPHAIYNSEQNVFYLFFAGNSYGKDGFGLLNLSPSEVGL
jgi:hypothetical protein